MLTIPPSTERLSEIGLFGGLDEKTLTDFVQKLPVIEVRTGDIVFKEGAHGSELFVVLSGEMEVLKHAKREREARVALLGPGDWFGDMSILDVMPRSATVRAVAPSRLMKMAASDLDNLYRRDMKAYSIILLNLAREISRRLRVADGILADMAASMADAYFKR